MRRVPPLVPLRHRHGATHLADGTAGAPSPNLVPPVGVGCPRRLSSPRPRRGRAPPRNDTDYQSLPNARVGRSSHTHGKRTGSPPLVRALSDPHHCPQACQRGPRRYLAVVGAAPPPPNSLCCSAFGDRQPTPLLP